MLLEKWQGRCFYQKGRTIINKQNLLIRQSDNSERPDQETYDEKNCARLCENQPDCHAFEYEKPKCRLYKDGDLSEARRIEIVAGFCSGKNKQAVFTGF